MSMAQCVDMKIVCYSVEIAGYEIKLIQTGGENFSVVYGAQTKTRLNYSEAAHELGGCIMHALACEDKLDNREKGE